MTWLPSAAGHGSRWLAESAFARFRPWASARATAVPEETAPLSLQEPQRCVGDPSGRDLEVIAERVPGFG